MTEYLYRISKRVGDGEWHPVGKRHGYGTSKVPRTYQTLGTARNARSGMDDNSFRERHGLPIVEYRIERAAVTPWEVVE